MNLGEWAAMAGGYTSDSRDCTPAKIFVALKGEQRDGHEFVKELLAQKKCRGAVVETSFASGNVDWAKAEKDRLWVVDDSHAAHRELAKIFRARFKGKLIAVGGSSGKTTTKDFLHQILSKRFRTLKTEKSQNGERGIPKTFERLTNDFEVAVIEVGIDAPGDMRRHMEVVAPDWGLLTSIGEEHLNLLKNVENVFREERGLFETTWARGGLCFAPESDAFLTRLRGTKNLKFAPPNPQDIDPSLISALAHPYALQNAALAALVALELGMNPAEVAAALKNLELPDGRGRLLQTRPDQWVLADHYNSNPSSLRAGLRYARFEAHSREMPLTLILGDMLDLGEESAPAHRALVEDLKNCDAQTIVLVGPLLNAHVADALEAAGANVHRFPDSEIAAQGLGFLKEASGVLFVKGSRGMKLEKLLRIFGIS